METIEQYLARGGKIRQFETKEYDRAAIYRKDTKLKALKQLRRQVKNEQAREQIDFAIDERILILKSCL